MSQVLKSISTKMRAGALESWRLDTGSPGKKRYLHRIDKEEAHLPLVAGREGGGEDGRATKIWQIKTVKKNNSGISMFELIWDSASHGDCQAGDRRRKSEKNVC